MPSQNQEILSERVKLLRKKFRLSQQYIADSCGCTRQYINTIEKKNTCVNPELLWNLSNILLCSPDYLLGRVAEPNQILSDYHDEEGKILSCPFQLGDFRDDLMRKIYIMSPDRIFTMHTIADCLKQCTDTEVNTFQHISKAFFHYKPKYEQTVLRIHDYIFCKLRDEILPNIQKDAYKFIFSTYRSDLECCKLTDNIFKNELDQNLGDFLRECKQKLQIKIKNAVIPNKQTPDKSISENDIDEIINHILECIKNDVEQKYASHSFKEQLKSNKDTSSVTKDYIAPEDISLLLDDIVSFIKADINEILSKEPIKPPLTKSHQEKASILRDLRRNLYLRRDTYSKQLLDDIRQFFMTN